MERRATWFAQFAPTGRYRLLVAEEDRVVLGYAGTTRFRPKAAYDTTVETTIYCAPEATGKGIGGKLYAALFDAIADEDIHRILAGYALPNPPLRHCISVSASNSLASSTRTDENSASIGTWHGTSGRCD